MKTSNHSSTIGASLVINGTYVKIHKFDNLLFVKHARTANADGAGTRYNILTITNQDNSTELLRLPTVFSVGGTSTWTQYILPLNVKSIVLTTQAVAPGDPGDPGDGVGAGL